MENQLTAGFDYGELPEAEVRAMERHIDQLADIRGTVARSAIETGRILQNARARLMGRRAGTFEQWCESRANMSARHARNFIAVAERFGDSLTGNNFRLLPDTSLFLLAAPSCPDQARKEAMKLADRGQVVTVETAKGLIEKHKPSPKPDLPAGYSPHGKPKKRRNKAGEDPVRAGTGVAGVLPDAPQPPRVGQPEEPDTEGPSGTEAPSDPEPPTAAALAVDLVRFQGRLSHVETAMGGGPFDGKTAGRHLECVSALLNGESPKHRLVSASDTAGQAAEIYDLYPRKVGRDKALATIRRSLKTVPFDELKEAVSEYAKSRIGKDEQFTPHPATWFGEGRWADDRSDWFRDEDRGRGSRRREPWERDGSRKNRPVKGGF